MRRIMVLASIIVSFLMVAEVAWGGGTRAQSNNPTTAVSGFVGTWRVVVTNPDGSTHPVLSSFMADGTTIHSGPISQPAAPGSVNAVIFQSAGNGVWEETATGTASVTFEVLTGDEKGNLLGRVTVVGVQTLASDGQSFVGRYDITISDPAGTTVATFATTASGERMRVQVPSPVASPRATPVA